jgi:CubicO group peptidase (beta-lactamase class C family)
MKNAVLQILIFILAGCPYNASGQQLHYTKQESISIHDSIAQSRWDVGGRLSHYSFRYMSEFFPTGIIHKADVPNKLHYKPKKSIEKLELALESDTVLLEEYLRKKHINSFIVLHKGVVVYEKYFTMLPQDQHSLQSITKVITSTLITHLINNNKINPAQPIEMYIPELAATDWKGIAIKDILNMRSGMDSASIDFESGPFTNPEHKNYKLESALGVLPKTTKTPKDVYQFIAGLKKEKAPGSAAEYSNINTFVLGWLAEKVTGKKYAELVSEIIWKPMGASSDAYICLSDKGIPWSHGGISTTLRDLALFGTLFTKSQIVSKKESIISFAQLKEIFDTPPIENSFAPFKWGYQWDLASDDIMMKGGFGGQALLINPKKEIVIAYFNFVDNDWGTINISEKVVSEIVKALVN